MPIQLKNLGYDAKSYSCDNYSVYDNTNIFHAQIERNYYASRKFGEAIEDSPQIALFDRSMFCNILFSQCFKEFDVISEREFQTIKKQFQSIQNRELCFKGRIFFLDLPVSKVIKQVLKRNEDDGDKRDGKINNILLNEKFILRLHEIYHEFYEQYEKLNPVYTLEEYNENIIIEEMKKHDIIQIMVK